jgi:hypothetical protein
MDSASADKAASEEAAVDEPLDSEPDDEVVDEQAANPKHAAISSAMNAANDLFIFLPLQARARQTLSSGQSARMHTTGCIRGECAFGNA